jgi:hypothetical protein
MYTTIWGAVTWDSIFFTVLALGDSPTLDAQNILKEYLRLRFKTLPCPDCNRHATHYYETNDFDYSSGDALFACLVTFKNAVNERTEKVPMTATQARQALVTRYIGDDIRRLGAADKRRVEDHARIRKLQNKIEALGGDLLNVDYDDGADVDLLLMQARQEPENNDDHTVFIVTTTVLGILVVVLIAIVTWLAIRMQRKTTTLHARQGR